MQKKIQFQFITSLKGLAMGAADVVPGVSGGTIAFITGIYEELINSISSVDIKLLKRWKKEGFFSVWKTLNGNFLASLFIGILVSIFTLMRLTNFLIEEHPIYIWSFFFGLVVASVLYVAKQIKSWKTSTILALIIGAIVAYGITLLTPSSGSTSLLFLFFSGSLAICAMILPGISGAFILVLLGAYKTVSEAVSNFDLKTIAVVGLGAVVGLLSFSKLLKWLLKRYENTTLAILTGFIAGSLNKIWPWKKVTDKEIVGDKEIILKEVPISPLDFDGEPFLWQAILMAILGFVLILILERLGNQKTDKA
ncbi:MAG: DUF368 domain-containing protein [Bacteroidota bacterium]